MSLRTGLLLIALAYFVDCQHANYDCRRQGTPCTGTCLTIAPNAGICDCQPGFTGDDCSLTGALVTDLALCSNPNCNTAASTDDAFCYTPTGQVTQACRCRAQFLPNTVPNPTCSSPRVSTACSANSMSMVVNPYPGAAFNGKLYVKGFSATTACNFPALAPSSTTFTHSITLGQCGATGTSNTGAGTTLYQVTVVVQYSPLFETIHDEEHTFVCTHFTDGRISATVGVQPATGRTGLTVNSQFNEFTRMEIRTGDGSNTLLSLSSSVVVGNPLNVNVILDNAQYQDLRVTQCSVYDTQSGTVGRREKVLVVDSCVPSAAFDVVRPPMSKAAKTITLPVDAVKFDGSDLLFFECDVLVCAGLNEAKCAVQTCNGGPNGFGRKKRQAEKPDVKVGGSFKVISREGTAVEVSCPASTHTVQSCMQSTSFVAVTSVFGVLLLVALAVSIFVCFRYTRNQRPKTDGNVPAVYVNKGMSSA